MGKKKGHSKLTGWTTELETKNHSLSSTLGAHMAEGQS